MVGRRYKSYRIGWGGVGLGGVIKTNSSPPWRGDHFPYGKTIDKQVDDKCLEGSGHDIGRDNRSGLNDEICGEDGEIVPKVEMKFKDDNEAFEFYKSYVYHLGFPVGKRNLKKGDDEL
ncbi:protein FAR1-RELATED SEQUENCE 5-like [Abeliophyllum distichum]|uniref:Protein FAR1-RELATED SEQUENCE 5-like n=1 Tax=Abeliophyllum distichum TaxID=126358 RepID=A0ABD1TJB5_9LAMI